MQVGNRLGEIRRKRGLAVALLAEAAGVTRQTIYSIEDGSFVPNTAVALRLARALDVAVEDLFFEAETSAAAVADIREAVLVMPGGYDARAGQFVQVCQVGKRVVAVPAAETRDFLPEGDAVLAEHRGSAAKIRAEREPDASRILIAGCDPALAVLPGRSTALLNCSSRRALQLLKDGLVHVAGCHVRDASGEYNTPLIRSMFRKGDVQIFTFAAWEQGLIVSGGNPKRIRTVADLARKSVSLVCRESGSGSHDLLQTELKRPGIDAGAITARASVAYGHLAAAKEIHAGAADCAVGSRAAAQFYGLDFIPLRQDRFDLVIPKKILPLAGVKALLDTMSTLRFRRRLQLFAGYETSHTGNAVI